MTLISELLVTRRMPRMIESVLGFALLLTCSSSVMADTGGGLIHMAAVGAGDAQIAVVYPDIGEPYRSVFEQIIAGIEDKALAGVVKFAVVPNVDIDELKRNLQQQNVKVVIALGQQGMKIASRLDRDMGVVVGGVIAPPSNEMRDVPVNSLSPDPALLFAHLKVLMPGVRRIYAVYDPRQSGWLISLAKEAARAQGMELVAHEAQDLRSAVGIYQEFFASADIRRDALWLLQDSISAENGSVLPLVLQESWSRNVAVFSSSSGHVRRGVLFSLYPDNAAMGRHLANAAQEYVASGEYGEHGMVLLHEVLMAINLRTADHLGLKPGNKLKFGMVFPEQ
jgi:putative tryptophan/tyrosine transport system substrate-binding protein